MEDKNLERLRQATEINPQLLNEDIVSEATGKSKPRNWVAFSSVAAAAVLVTAIALGQPGPKAPLIDLSVGLGNADQDSVPHAYGKNDVILMTPEYKTESSVSNESTKGHVYELNVVGTSISIARRAAKALNFSGEESTWTSSQQTFIRGELDADGNAHEVLTAEGSGTGAWDYYKASEDSPEPVEVPITDNQARAQAVEIFAATGLDVQSNEVTLYRNEIGLAAMAELKVDGQVTGLHWFLRWNGQGEIVMAQGNSVEVTDRGEYKNFSPIEAMKRASGRFWQVISVSATIQPPRESGGLVDPSKRNPISKVTLTNGLVQDIKGRSWLVPSYALFSKSGTFEGVVIALEDDVITLPEPMVIID